MPSLIVRLGEAHMDELRARFSVATLVYLDQLPLPPNVGVVEGLAAEPSCIDQAGRIDAFVRRCIGTVVELEAHRAQGGAIFMQHRDGSVRELVVDATQDGVKVFPDTPRPSEAARRQFGRGRKRS